MIHGEPHRAIAGNGLIGHRPSDGTPAWCPASVCRWGLGRCWLLVPGEAGTSEAAEARCDESNDGDSSSDETIVMDPPRLLRTAP